MDTYLCKAKRIENGEWYEGYVLKYGFSGKEKWYIIPDHASALYTFEIEQSTICRCTGIKDVNGKQIYENDILMQKTTETFKKDSDMEWELYGIVKFGEYDFNKGNGGDKTQCFYIEHLNGSPINPLNYAIGSLPSESNQKDSCCAYCTFKDIGNVFTDYAPLKI